MIVTGHPGMKARILDAALDTCISTIPHETPITAVAFAGNCNMLVTGSLYGKIMIWENAIAGSTRCIYVFSGSVYRIKSLSVSPGQRWLVSSGGGFKVWNLPSISN